MTERFVVVRFLTTLEIVRRQLTRLEYSCERLFSDVIDRQWIERLDQESEDGDRLEAFVSRFFRLQDTMSEKLVPHALTAVLERPGSVLDNLNRAEKLGWIENANEWARVRDLRSRLIHEYRLNAGRLAEDLRAAGELVALFRPLYRKLLALAVEKFGVAEEDLVDYLTGEKT